MIWEEAVAFALSLPDTVLSSSYGKPAVKTEGNGRAFLMTGHESDSSFVVALDLDSIELLKASEPATYWQTGHYEGWPAVLVRYDAKDDDRFRDVIRRGRDGAAARPKARPRRK